MQQQENRAVIAWRGAASAELVSSADRAYMKAPSLAPHRTSGQNVPNLWTHSHKIEMGGKPWRCRKNAVAAGEGKDICNSRKTGL